MLFWPFPGTVEFKLGAVGREWALALDVWVSYCTMMDALACMSVSVCAYLRQYSLQCRMREASSCWSLQRSTQAFILWQRPNVEAHSTIESLSSSLLPWTKASRSSHSLETLLAPRACL